MSSDAPLLIFNATPFSFDLSGQHSYQMDWNPPGHVTTMQKTSFSYSYEDTFGFNDSEADDAAEAYYNLGSTGQCLKLFAKVDASSSYFQFSLFYSSSWNNPNSGVLIKPLYMASTSSDPRWRLLSCDNRLVSENQGGWLKIAQIDHFCKQSDDSMIFATDIINEQQDSQRFKDFAARVEQAISAM